MATEDQQLEEKEFRFLSVFKWEKRKGWNFLLEAFLQVDLKTILSLCASEITVD